MRNMILALGLFCAAVLPAVAAAPHPAKRHPYPADCRWNYYAQTLPRCGKQHALAQPPSDHMVRVD